MMTQLSGQGQTFYAGAGAVADEVPHVSIPSTYPHSSGLTIQVIALIRTVMAFGTQTYEQKRSVPPVFTPVAVHRGFFPVNALLRAIISVVVLSCARPIRLQGCPSPPLVPRLIWHSYSAELRHAELAGRRKSLWQGLSMALVMLIVFLTYALSFW